MVSVFDVACFFIDVAKNSSDDYMTNLKLNKLLYYAQGVYLARTGKPLFREDFQAWEYGPVIPEIYQKYKNTKHSITKVDTGFSYDLFSPEEIDVLTDVMNERGQYTGSHLINLTHNEAPWKEVYQPGKKGIVISKDSLLNYFTANPIKKFKISDRIKTVKAIPKEYYDSLEDEIWKECQDEV